MKKRLSRLFPLWLMIICLIFSACIVIGENGAPAIRPVLVSQPKDVTVKEGGKCSVTVGETGATGITWRFFNPYTEETVLASKASSTFKGLKVSGQNSDDLRLSNVPASLNGWMAYCTLANKQGNVISDYALITVTDKKGNPLPVEWETDDDDDDDYLYDDDDDEYYDDYDFDDDDIIIVGVNCTIRKLGKNDRGTGEAYDELTFKKTASFEVTPTVSTEYWVFNGVRYDFEYVPKYIVVTGLTESVTFEAVAKKGVSDTILTEDEIQESRTGKKLLVKGINAKLCHIKNTKTGAGGYFDEFDFTNDYTNRATGKKEDGGRVTVKVTAKSGSRYSSWKFNTATLKFSSAVDYFFVRELDVSMTYEPLKGSVQKTATPTRAPNNPAQPVITPTVKKVTTAPKVITPTPKPRKVITPTPIPRKVITPTPTVNIRPRITYPRLR